jgi:hypothetical protein
MKQLGPILDGPLGGEAWAKEPRAMPYDRPPQHADAEEALESIFKRLRQPPIAKKLLNLMSMGMPIDMLVESMIIQGFTEGKYGAPILAQLAAPLTVIMWRMAETAGIEPMTSSDKTTGVDFDPVDMLAAEKRIQTNPMEKAVRANEMSAKELQAPNMADRQGFMKFRPKPKLGGK